MVTESDESLTDKDKLLFGAGFVFGVMVTLLLLAAVLAVTAGDGGDTLSPGSSVLVTAVGGGGFAGIVGAGLYVLAFPENRTRVRVDPALFGVDDEE